MNPMASWPAMGSTGEVILFWCVAVLMVGGALGVLFFKKAAYAAISMITVMLGLAVLYFALGAPFLGAVQVVVYTGAIMMLFLFVLMMIGVGASDEYQRQRRGNIVGAVIGALGLAVILIGILAHTSVSSAVGLSGDPYSNEPVTSLAASLFSKHWLSMELAGTLLITAAIGAMLLTHTDRLGPSISQRATVEAKMRAFKESGRRIGQLPAPGVYAETNAVDVPAISGATMGPVEESVPRVLRVRGLDRSLSQVAPEVAESLQLERAGDTSEALHGAAATESVPRSGAWGMPGPSAPGGLRQPAARPLTSAEPTGPAILAEDEHEHLDAGRPGTDHVSGPGASAAHTAVPSEDAKEEEK
ncbi:NADH-quinone oxidoreductase subunit J [Schaalia naturae]|uniref:NADH-quinone oxidoreductase subunit J n=1 Tax=Schaalia naturae TaxID=635203 RepID=A0ABW2SJE7_9ACTO